MMNDAVALPSGTALTLLNKYCLNMRRNPTSLKFRRIRVLNPKFYKTVWKDVAARELLVEVGFELDEVSADGPWLILPQTVDPAPFQSAIEDALVMHEARQSALAIAEAMQAYS